ncbi:hypothetical protein BRYFOR_05062 [Marvinbryantia formatexigens DSM 14469]|uniref:Uncharacterized protein n=1 Tax=Marvinbryantia formatexigens DSM 14469 TaxID=478749 RepID=C6L8X3_9FIRM|nr:hypothetical protein [Marvinbryantia formatexigens]EET62712.1 hypothetical protein BRYFOR_05062 [Marvinbryantia formatexigens DSM 14469]UWO23082.1 hypothetical protein NQ534_11465 [Marvinbryantia formatexigens DSM 14469]SDF98516.1 hypothetical protein SAMN05660368_01692 [Marvinbryantia formatexigens]
MNNQEKVRLLKQRLQNLEISGKENGGVQRRIRRDIRNLEKGMTEEERRSC